MGACVVDFGSSSCKFGLAGEDNPRICFDSTVYVHSDADGADAMQVDGASSSSSAAAASSASSASSDARIAPARRTVTRKDVIVSDLSRPPSGKGQLMSVYWSGVSSSLKVGEAALSSGFYESGHHVPPTLELLDLEGGGDGLFGRLFDNGTGSLFGESSSLEHPILFAEKSYNPPELRSRLAELLFESKGAPSLFLARDAVLSCYACGKATAVVVDVGGTSTTVTPVHEGWVESRGIMHSPIGGDALDAAFLGILDAKAGAPVLPIYAARLPQEQRQAAIRGAPRGYHEYARQVVGRHGREAVAKIAEIGYTPDDIRYIGMIKAPYELPDGTKVEFETDRFDVGELLLGRASLARDRAAAGRDGLSAAPVQQLVCEAAFKCERDQQASLLSTVVLSGGGACIDGIVDRLRMEVENVIHAHTPGWRVKVLSPAPAERKICAWLGGSILASLGTFHENWISKAEYEEHGGNIVNRKCP